MHHPITSTKSHDISLQVGYLLQIQCRPHHANWLLFTRWIHHNISSELLWHVASFVMHTIMCQQCVHEVHFPVYEVLASPYLCDCDQNASWTLLRQASRGVMADCLWRRLQRVPHHIDYTLDQLMYAHWLMVWCVGIYTCMHACIHTWCAAANNLG